jgi:hypothetical protein
MWVVLSATMIFPKSSVSPCPYWDRYDKPLRPVPENVGKRCGGFGGSGKSNLQVPPKVVSFNTKESSIIYEIGYSLTRTYNCNIVDANEKSILLWDGLFIFAVSGTQSKTYYQKLMN